MKRGEKSRFTVSPEYCKEKEDEGMEAFLAGTPWESHKVFIMDIELVNITKVEDWYGGRNGSVVVCGQNCQKFFDPCQGKLG